MRNTFLNLVQKQLNNCFIHSKIPTTMQKILLQPTNEIIFNFPVKLDNGTIEMFKGYRIQHNNILGPYKGGIRFHQDVHLDEVKALFFVANPTLTTSQKHQFQIQFNLIGRAEAITLDVAKDLISHMKEKDYKSVRKWVVENMDNDPTKLFRKIYDYANDYIQPATIPHLVLILADYQHKQAFSADSEINVLACLTEIMGQCKFK